MEKMLQDNVTNYGIELLDNKTIFTTKSTKNVAALFSRMYDISHA